MDSVNKPMTAAEKIEKLERFASYTTGSDNAFSDLLLEAAAHFRSLIPDANGLLPCPMCGADGRPEILEEVHKGMAWHRGRCVTCGLATAKKWMRSAALAAWNRRGGVAYE